MKISILDFETFSLPSDAWKGFNALGETVMWPSTSPEETAAHIGDAEAVITCRANISAEDIKNCPNVKYIGVAGDDCSILELRAIQAMGIGVASVQDWNTAFAAQHVLSLIHSALKDSGHPEVSGLTVGLIGNGDSARMLAEMLNLLGASIVVYEKGFNMAYHKGVTKYIMDADEFLPKCDVISIHRPFLAIPDAPFVMRGMGGVLDLRNFMSEQNISKMKDGAVLIDAFGYGVVDGAAAVRAKETGKLRDFISCPVPVSPFSQQKAIDASVESLKRHIMGMAEYVW